MTLLVAPGTATHSRPSQPGPGATLAVIRVLAAAAILVAILAAFVLATSAGGVRDGFDVIGHRTAPQVAETEDLYFALADMDAQLTNVLLAGDDANLATTRQDGLDVYEKRRRQADADLQQATTVAGSDPAAQRTVRDVLDQLGAYQALAAKAIMLNDQEGNPAGRPSKAVLDLHHEATDQMSATLRSAHRLTETNSAVLDQSYQDKRDATVTTRWWLTILGVLLVGALVAAQIVLRLRMRRRINPALVLATILAAATVVGGVALMAVESEHLRGAKEDAFDSLLALRQARAVSYDANADESRYLVDPGRATEYGQSFQDSEARINEYLDTELNNITFTGERAAAEKAVTAYRTYLRDDRTIRDMAERGDLEGAIAFCTSVDPGSSNYDFYAYDDALVAVIDINQHAFEKSIADGDAAVSGWTALIPYGAGALIVLLVVAGVWPRLAEYR